MARDTPRPAVRPRLLARGRRGLPVGSRLLGHVRRDAGPVPARAAAEPGEWADVAAAGKRLDLGAGNVGVAEQSIRVAARVLGPQSARMDVGSGVKLLDTQRLRL